MSAPPVPHSPTLPALRSAAQECRAGELWRDTTQAVMGEGATDAELMLVGEQPGDREDREGHPFVGPAGRVLAQGIESAGIDRERVFVTNVVKHFRHETRGRRRIHQRPDRTQVSACLPWLWAELEIVQPRALVCMGATAAQALIDPHVRIGRDRGRRFDSTLAPHVTLTAHPSSILRAPDEGQRRLALAEFIGDLTNVAELLRRG